MNFDMNACWARAIELVRSNIQLLIVLAGVFVLLPSLAIYLLLPDAQMFFDPTADPEALGEQMIEAAGTLIPVGFISLAVQFAGYGAMVSLMGDERPTVGQALAIGAKAVPGLFAVLILFLLLYIIGGLLIALPITLLVGTAGVPALGLLVFPVVLLFVGWLAARMSLVMPVMVLKGTLNPFRAITRSFALTGKNQWMILLFWGVLIVIFMIITLLLGGIFGLIAAVFGSGTVASLILGLANGIISSISAVLISALAVALYGQLSGPSAKTIAETFD